MANHIQNTVRGIRFIFIVANMAGFLADVAGMARLQPFGERWGWVTAGVLFKISPRKIDVLRSIN